MIWSDRANNDDFSDTPLAERGPMSGNRKRLFGHHSNFPVLPPSLPPLSRLPRRKRESVFAEPELKVCFSPSER